MYKYIILNTNFTYVHGLNDMKNRFSDFLKLSLVLKLIPILPRLKLTKFHLHKGSNSLDNAPITPITTVSTELSRKNNDDILLENYIIIPNFVLRKIPPNTLPHHIFVWNPTRKFLPNDILIRQYANEMYKINLHIDYNYNFRKIAKNIVKRFSRPICCIHVRRGDYIPLRQSLLHTTTPMHINNVLDKSGGPDHIKTLYIMSNENDPNFFDPLKTLYNLKLYSDIPLLKEMKIRDNYALYAVECFILDFANIRISTFNTINSPKQYLPHLNTNYFHHHLDNTRGLQ